MKRTFRGAATISGLIERNMPGKRKSGRQATFSSDILYDTLLKYDPDHLLMQITRQEAMRGLVDFARIEDLLDPRRNPDRSRAHTPCHPVCGRRFSLKSARFRSRAAAPKNVCWQKRPRALMMDSGLAQM